MEGASPDPNDAATRTCTPPPNRDYTPFLNAGGLEGARIGVPRAFYINRVTLPGQTAPRGGLNAAQAKVMAEAIAVLRQQGAIVVDPADLPSFVATHANDSFPLFEFCAGAEHAKGKDAGCTSNFKYRMKRDFNAWLASLGPSAPVKTLTELRNWNLAHARANAIRYQQSRLDISDEIDLAADQARYEADRAKDRRLSRDQGIDAVVKAHRLDALIAPGGSGAGVAARAGYPVIAVPFGMVPNAPNPPFPAGFNARPAPFGVTLVGPQCSEPRLIEIAYAFEQATKRRVPPMATP
jgi:amidase